ncbi:MAG: NAD-dependent epimerase/dehydratase family protein [Thermodesulfobacteriota bacterium]
MKILVTGGAGFIGSNVVDAFVAEGHDVIVVDDLSSGKEENLNPEVSFHKMDIRSAELRKLVSREKPDIINHHAAQISVPASVEDPALDAGINVLGFINVLEAARENKTEKVIFISSGGAIYGEADEFPTSETYPPKPLSPYAITKAVSEQYLAFYAHQHGLNFTTLRYANVYGPRQIPHGEAGVVAIFMDRLLSGKSCSLYHFEDEPKGMTRDYCFVSDIARANVAALSTGSGEAFNIGTGMATHTLDLYNGVFSGLEKRVPDLSPDLKDPVRGPARAGDIKRSCLNVEKAKAGLGFTAEVELTEGIEKTLDWRLARK